MACSMSVVARCVLALLLAVPLIGRAQESGQDVLDLVRKKYDSMTDAEVRFTQKVKFSLSTAEAASTGTLQIKKPNKYRLEMGDQTVVTDGTTVWSYSKPLNQVLVDKYKEDERSLTPEHLLLGTSGGYTPVLVGTDRIGKTETKILKLTPKDEQSMVSAIRLWVDDHDWTVKQVEVLDVNGKQTTYTVLQLKFNPGLADSRFVFQAPEGAEVVDLRK